MATKPSTECCLDCSNNNDTYDCCVLKCQQRPAHQVENCTPVQSERHRIAKFARPHSVDKPNRFPVAEHNGTLDTTYRHEKGPEKYHLKNAANFAKAYVNLKHRQTVACSITFTGLVDFNRPLSVREWEILYLSVFGLTNEQISAILSISRNTVKSHFDHIYTKLGVSNRIMAVVWALRQGLI